MGITEWIIIGMWGFAQITALVITHINIRVKLKELEMKVISIEAALGEDKTDLHEHEKMNEKAFVRVDDKLDKVYESINDVKTFLMSK